ncbi:MAG TPA: hypothetical protein VLB44_15150 [Kofleriaceae bacterium]|nr:hypothetical protein [Kofleriaceae bacterium]
MDPGALEPGDLVLVKSPGLVFRLGRTIGGNPYDHVGVVVSNGQTINIDKPSARLLPVERLVRARLRPLVLRPVWESPEARDRFVAWIESLSGREYDVRRTLRLIGRLMLKRFLRVTWPLERPDAGRAKWICTDAVLLGLEQFGKDHEVLRTLPLDWNALRCATTNDFLVINERHPELMQRVS